MMSQLSFGHFVFALRPEGSALFQPSSKGWEYAERA
jgi:hypothetical protein